MYHSISYKDQIPKTAAHLLLLIETWADDIIFVTSVYGVWNMLRTFLIKICNVTSIRIETLILNLQLKAFTPKSTIEIFISTWINISHGTASFFFALLGSTPPIIPVEMCYHSDQSSPTNMSPH